jgi:hypothetical protein
MPLILKEKVLYHQIHPWKLFADIGCEPLSLYLFWRHELAYGLIAHFLPPLIASVCLIRYANLETYQTSKVGASLRHRMTRAVEAIRLGGDVLMVVAAWFHKPWWIAAGGIGDSSSVG